MLSSIMQGIGVTPLTAPNGEIAIEIYLREKPQIVFSDILMPKVNGLILLKKLKEFDSNLPVILFTGYQHYKHMNEVSEIKADNFLEKPLQARHIIEIMLRYFPQLRK
jgi:YesN/AraC family two-component response regulator